MTTGNVRIRLNLGDEMPEARDDDGVTVVSLGPWAKRRDLTVLTVSGTIQARQQFVTAMAKAVGLGVVYAADAPPDSRPELCPECPHKVDEHSLKGRFIGCNQVGCYCLAVALRANA